MSFTHAKTADIAASAALYVTKGRSDKSDKPDRYPLDADGKLSSASTLSPLSFAFAFASLTLQQVLPHH